MSKLLCFLGISVLFTCLSLCLEATPTSCFWTNCTTDVVDTGNANFQLIDCFTVFNKRRRGSAFFTDVGMTVGVWSWCDLSAEVGWDYLGAAGDPWFFNGKIGMKEDKIACWAPSWSLGIFNAGTRHTVTDQNVINFVMGHSLPDPIGGRLFVAAYHGNAALGPHRNGFMLGYTKGFCHVNPNAEKDDDDSKDKSDNKKPGLDICKACDDSSDDESGYDKWVFYADYCSGKNFIGGGGVGIQYYFTENISVETGPMFFNSRRLNGDWKWCVQVYIGFPLFDPPWRF